MNNDFRERHDPCSNSMECGKGQETDQITSCTTCSLRKKSLLNDLDESELSILNVDRSRKFYKAGDTIFNEGDQPEGLLCLNSGKIKITRSGDEGNEMILDLKKPVEFVAINALLTDNGHTNTATAIEDTSLCIVKKESFFEVLKNNPKFSIRLLQFLAKKIDDSEKRIINLTNKHMRARLAEALLIIFRTYGMDGNNILNVEMKRSELAALANMSPANAIRILSAFVNEGIVQTNKKKITITDMEGLKEICKFGYTRKTDKNTDLFE